MTTASDIDLEEKIARIRQLTADAERKDQERFFAPRQFQISLVTAIAIAFAAGGTFAAGIATIIKVLWP